MRAGPRSPVRDTQAEGVTIDVEPTAIQSWPCHHTDAREPTLKSRVTPFTIRRVDRIVGAVARIKFLQEVADDRRLILLHRIPQRHIDRHTASLNLRDRLGAVVRPMQHEFDIGGC